MAEDLLSKIAEKVLLFRGHAVPADEAAAYRCARSILTMLEKEQALRTIPAPQTKENT